VIGRQRQRNARTIFAQNEVLICDSRLAYTLAPGHEARRLACVVCDQAIGGEPMRIIGAITSIACPNDGTHLLAGGHMRHDACPRPDDQTLATKLVKIIANDPS
jgi:hypothetical protein